LTDEEHLFELKSKLNLTLLTANVETVIEAQRPSKGRIGADLYQWLSESQRMK